MIYDSIVQLIIIKHSQTGFRISCLDQRIICNIFPTPDMYVFCSSLDTVTLFIPYLIPCLVRLISHYNLSWELCTVTGFMSFTYLSSQFLSILHPMFSFISLISLHSTKLVIFVFAIYVLLLEHAKRQLSTQYIHITSSHFTHLKYRHGSYQLREYFINLNSFSNSL